MRMHALSALQHLYLQKQHYTDEKKVLDLYELTCLVAKTDHSADVRDFAIHCIAAMVMREFEKQGLLVEKKYEKQQIPEDEEVVPVENKSNEDMENRVCIVLLQLSRCGVINLFTSLIDTEFDCNVLGSVVYLSHRYLEIIQVLSPNLLKQPQSVLERACKSFSIELEESQSKGVLKFLDFLKNDDLKKRLNETESWTEKMSGFDSLLDDMLVDDGDSNVNDLDCY